MKRNKKKTRIAYAISLGENTRYEVNLESELLLFDNLDQIAEYCNVNDINIEQVSVHEFEVYKDPIGCANEEEIEF